MPLEFVAAGPEDAEPLARLRQLVADDLTRRVGRGHWSSAGTAKGALRTIRNAQVVLIRDHDQLVGSLTLTTTKPWAIDVSHFTACRRPLYLIGMAVRPTHRGLGVGRAGLLEADRLARKQAAEALRLDAYDGPAGAGPFYARAGFREVGRVTYRGTPLVYFERILTD